MELEKLMQRSIQHLYQAANVLKNSDTSNILKTYYLTRCQKLRWKGNCNLPSALLKPTHRCSHCCVLFADQNPSYKIVASNKKRSRFFRRLTNKIQHQETLTPFQQIAADRLIKNGEIKNHNKLVTVCGICRRKQRTVLEKPALNEPDSISVIEKRKKKRKRKDHSAGLNPEYVLSNKKSKLNSSTSSTKKEETVKNSPHSAGSKIGASASKVKKLLKQSSNYKSPLLKDFLNSLSK